jgi:hypothetical protein
MAKREGVRRIVLAGRLILLIGITCGVLGSLGMWVFVGIGLVNLGGMLAAVAVVLVPIGASLWVVGWIVDGFSQPDA